MKTSITRSVVGNWRDHGSGHADTYIIVEDGNIIQLDDFFPEEARKGIRETGMGPKGKFIVTVEFDDED